MVVRFCYLLLRNGLTHPVLRIMDHQVLDDWTDPVLGTLGHPDISVVIRSLMSEPPGLYILYILPLLGDLFLRVSGAINEAVIV